MAQIKCTKIELNKYKKKRERFLKYLPVLQLKKMLLQMEVFKAQAEIDSAKEKMEKQYAIVKGHSSLLTDPSASEIESRVQIEEVVISRESIAGIDVPTFKDVVFRTIEANLVMEPIWFDDMISMIRVLKKAFQKVKVAQEKKELLAAELRTVSIRVNLFEKRMIPETTAIINRIKIFLSDQALQAVARAKVSKNKLLIKKEREAV